MTTIDRRHVHWIGREFNNNDLDYEQKEFVFDILYQSITIVYNAQGFKNFTNYNQSINVFIAVDVIHLFFIYGGGILRLFKARGHKHSRQYRRVGQFKNRQT